MFPLWSVEMVRNSFFWTSIFLVISVLVAQLSKSSKLNGDGLEHSFRSFGKENFFTWLTDSHQIVCHRALSELIGYYCA